VKGERLPSVNPRPLVLGLLSLAALAGLWQLLAATGTVNTFLTSSPSRVATALVAQIRAGILGRDVATSMEELGIGFAMAAFAGVAVGLAVGRYRTAEYAVNPFVSIGYSAPFVALYPVFTVLFGLGRPTVIATAFLLGVFPIVVNTARGVKGVDPKLVQVARSFGAREAQIFYKITLPASVKAVMAGLRLGLGQTLLGVIIGELFVGNAGLGYEISYYGGLERTDQMLAAVVVTGLLGIVLTGLVGLIERQIDAWRPDIGGR